MQIKLPYFIVISKISQDKNGKLTFLGCSIPNLYYTFKYYNCYYCPPLGNILRLFKNKAIKGVLKEKYENAIYYNYSLKKTAYMICY